MNDDATYDLRVYAEGVRIPAYSVTRTQQVGAPLSFHVRIPPKKEAFNVLPNTVVHVFVREKTQSDESASGEPEEDGAEWSLFAEGRVKGRQLKSSKTNNLATVLRCKGMSADWDEVRMGFDIGSPQDLIDSKKTNFFFGFSTGEKDKLDAEGPFPGFEAGRAGGFLKKFGNEASRFLSFKSGLDRYLAKGPVQAAVSILASMPAFSPLFRRNYNALQIQNRIGYVENRQITNWLKQQNIQNTLSRRVRSFKPNSSLLDVMRYILRTSFHEMSPLASPPFRGSAETRPQTEIKDKKPETIGEGDPDTTSPDAPISELEQHPAVQSYLDVIAKAEHWEEDNLKITSEDIRLYETRYDGSRDGATFNMFDGHPRIDEEVEGQELSSSAAGRYQITKNTLDWLRNTGAPVPGFTPDDQDRAAIALLKREGAIGPILNGNIKKANIRASDRWQAIPGEGGAGEKQPYSHEDLTESYNIFLDANMIGAGAEAPGKIQKGGVEGKAVEQTAEVPGTLPTTLVKPTLRDAPPPVSNLVMPSDIEDLQVGEQFDQSPTRLMMRRNISFQKGRRNLAKKIFRKKAFAPRRLGHIIRNLDDGGKFRDIDITKHQEEKEERRKEEKENPADGSDLEEAWGEIVEVRAVKKEHEAKESKDMFSGVLRGETDLGDASLLQLYTVDELFRGIHPVMGNFPFPKISGTEAASIEKSVLEDLAENTDVIDELIPLPEAYEKGGAEERREASESITANSIWADYQLSMMRRQSRNLSYSGPLNLRLAVGFPMALNHPSIGWVEGTVQQIRDTIDVQQGSATTRAQVSHCRFHVDEEVDAWKHMEMSSNGDASALDKAGKPSRPLFYSEEEYGPDNIGEEVYQKLLQVGSAVDLAAQWNGGDAPIPDDALNLIYRAYDQADDPRLWIENHLRRPIATEEETMGKAIGANRNAKDWGSTFPAFKMPGKHVFVESRADWALSLRQALAETNYTINATFEDGE